MSRDAIATDADDYPDFHRSMPAAEALAAEGLLVTDDQQRLIELGRKWEEHAAVADEMVAQVTDEDVLAMQAHFKEQQQLIRLGEAVMLRRAQLRTEGWEASYLDAIYAEAERSGQ